MEKQKVERNNEIYNAYTKGNKTLNEIGIEYGLTRERVRQILTSLGYTPRRTLVSERITNICRYCTRPFVTPIYLKKDYCSKDCRHRDIFTAIQCKVCQKTYMTRRALPVVCCSPECAKVGRTMPKSPLAYVRSPELQARQRELMRKRYIRIKSDPVAYRKWLDSNKVHIANWIKRHPEKHKESVKIQNERRKHDPIAKEKERKRIAKYYQEHKEEILAKRRVRYQNDPEYRKMHVKATLNWYRNKKKHDQDNTSGEGAK